MYPMSPNTLVISGDLPSSTSIPKLSLPPRKPLKRRSRVSRRPSGSKRLEVLPELSEAEEDAFNESQSDCSSLFSIGSRTSQRRPRPIGITRASDLLELGQRKQDVQVKPRTRESVVIRTPSPLSPDGESATLSFIAHFEGYGLDANQDGYQLELDFSHPRSGAFSPTPSIDSLVSSVSSSSSSSPSSSPSHPRTLPKRPRLDVPYTVSASISENSLPGNCELNWHDNLEDLWSQMDDLLAWNPANEKETGNIIEPYPSDWSVFPGCSSPAPSSILSYEEPKYPAKSLDPYYPRLPEDPVKPRFTVPDYPPPPPPKDSKQCHSQTARGVPLDVPTDVTEEVIVPNPLSFCNEPRSRFSVSTIDSPLFSDSLPSSRLSTSSRPLLRPSSRSSFSGSECSCSTSSSSVDSNQSRGTRRKPIPLELFIRR